MSLDSLVLRQVLHDTSISTAQEGKVGENALLHRSNLQLIF